MKSHLTTLAIGAQRYFLFAIGPDMPTMEEWSVHMRALSDYRRLQENDMGAVRIVMTSEGGMPDSTMRVELQRLIERAPVAVISDNQAVRGVVTAMRWSNPNIAIFAPEDGERVVKHLGISGSDVRILLVPALRTLSHTAMGGRAINTFIGSLAQEKTARA